MATDLVINLNGTLVSDPKVKSTTANGDAIWNFSMALNHKDNATTWINITFFGSPKHKILSEAKKGTTLRVAAKLPWELNEWTFGFNQEKKSGSLQLQAFGVERGVFDSKKEGDSKPQTNEKTDVESPDSFFPEDDLIPASNSKMKELMDELPLGVDE
jgi:single-stranded DNA-binding protein